jgi:hypothetical protein
VDDVWWINLYILTYVYIGTQYAYYNTVLRFIFVSYKMWIMGIYIYDAYVINICEIWYIRVFLCVLYMQNIMLLLLLLLS